MMKKMVIMWVALAMTVLVGINVVKGFTGEVSVEEKIMEEYIDEEYGEECYGALLDCDEEWIRFVVYENGVDRWHTSINREYYAHKYSE